MLVGDKGWQLVSTDTAGVPHGGRYGDVAWFERECERHGLHVGWSLIHHAFVVYSTLGPGRHTCQMQFGRWTDDGYKPIPFTRERLWLLLTAWDRFCRRGTQSFKEWQRQTVRNEKARMEKERDARIEAALPGALREFRRRRGQSRTVFSMPRTGPVIFRPIRAAFP